MHLHCKQLTALLSGVHSKWSGESWTMPLCLSYVQRRSISNSLAMPLVGGTQHGLFKANRSDLAALRRGAHDSSEMNIHYTCKCIKNDFHFPKYIFMDSRRSTSVMRLVNFT